MSDMVRLLFPEIRFSGRIGRSAFWGELVIAAMTTPVVVGLLTMVVYAVTDALDAGLTGTLVQTKVFAGLLLTLIGIRNTIAFAGVVKRRMNDIGIDMMELRRAFGAVLGLIVVGSLLASGLPLELRYLTGLLLVWLIFVLVGNAARLAFQLVFAGRRTDLNNDTGHPAPESAENALIGAIRKSIERWQTQGSNDMPLKKLLQTLGADFNKAFQDKGMQKRLQETQAIAQKLPGLVKIDAVRRWLDQPVAGHQRSSVKRGHARSEAPTTRDAVARPQQRGRNRAVRPTYRQPTHGRSSWLAGIWRGPWG